MYIDYEENIRRLTNRVDNIITKDMYTQGSILNSEYYNITFESLEDIFNHFYEDLRILEDIKEYTTNFINQEIKDKTKKCTEMLKSIESVKDMAKKESYTIIQVPFRLKNEEYLDRDFKNIKKCHVSNNIITISGETISDVVISNTKLNSYDLTPYNNNVNESIVNDKHYRSFYVLDGPVKNGIKEEITLSLNNNSKVNFINVNTTNCKVEKVTFIDENNVINEDDYNPPAKADRVAKEIKILLNCINYKEETYNIDETRIDNDFWTKVEDKEYNIQSGKNSLLDIEDITGVEKYKEEYEKYVKDLAEWNKEKARVEEVNQKIKAAYEKNMAEYNNEYEEYKRNL